MIKTLLLALEFSLTAAAYAIDPNPKILGPLKGGDFIGTDALGFSTLLATGPANARKVRVHRFTHEGLARDDFDASLTQISSDHAQFVRAIGPHFVTSAYPIYRGDGTTAAPISTFAVTSSNGERLIETSPPTDSNLPENQSFTEIHSPEENVLLVGRGLTVLSDVPTFRRYDLLDIRSGQWTRINIDASAGTLWRADEFGLLFVKSLGTGSELWRGPYELQRRDLNGTLQATQLIRFETSSLSVLPTLTHWVTSLPSENGKVRVLVYFDFMAQLLTLDSRTLRVQDRQLLDRMPKTNSRFFYRNNQLIEHWQGNFPSMKPPRLIWPDGDSVYFSETDKGFGSDQFAYSTYPPFCNRVDTSECTMRVARVDLSRPSAWRVKVQTSEQIISNPVHTLDGGGFRIQHIHSGSGIPAIPIEVSSSRTEPIGSIQILTNPYVSSGWYFDPLSKSIRATKRIVGDDYIALKMVTPSGDWALGSIQIRVLADNEKVLTEHYNVDLNHFFMTSDSTERRSILNGGAGKGWILTGEMYVVWEAGAPGTVPVCRFYGNPTLGPNGKRMGPNSHFYTADLRECELVERDPGWLLESRTAFGVRAYSSDNQSCQRLANNIPFGTPIYRFFNGRSTQNDANHRFTQFEASHWNWIAEGPRFCTGRSLRFYD